MLGKSVNVLLRVSETFGICLKIVFCLFFSQNLRKMEGETQEPVKDLNELQNADWVRAIPQAKIMLLNAVRLGSVKGILILQLPQS